MIRMKITKNFSKSEFECSCGCEMPLEVFHNIQKVANQLQVLRNITGKSISINSGYRCPDYNDNVVKGAKNSQHKLGKAADIVVKGIEPNVTAEMLESLISDGEVLQGGLGRYNTFTHYDIRGSKARWNFKK